MLQILKRFGLLGLLIFSYKLNHGYCNSISNALTTWIPRQLSYNPILENALTKYNKFSTFYDQSCGYYISFKPIYMKNTGDKLQRYFNIDRKKSLAVREDGSGDIDPAWFQVTGPNNTYYSSCLSLRPESKAAGTMFNFEMSFLDCWYFSVNTALLSRKNKFYFCESNIQNIDENSDFPTLQSSFSSNEREFGKICPNKELSKTTLDDIQLKIGKHFYGDCSMLNVYGLIGIPTGNRPKSVFLFEPLVGSKHAQLGLGFNFIQDLIYTDYCDWSLLGEFKWRYAFKGKENRIFDLKNNGQWSRYMLFVDQASPLVPFFASNKLAFQTEVTPKTSIDVYLATHFRRDCWHFEFGYDFWYRQKEELKLCCNLESNLGIADLPGIANLDATSASTANISQSVGVSSNQIQSDASFVTVQQCDINLDSARQPKVTSNSIYFSLARDFDFECNPTQLGLNVSYEKGSNLNVWNNVLVWVNLDVAF